MANESVPPITSTFFPAPIQVSPEQALRVALSSPGMPRIYANSFTNFLGTVDITILFGVSGVPAGVVSLSYPLAKTLAEKLAEIVAQYEGITKVSVSGTDVLDAAMQADAEAKAVSDSAKTK